MNITKTLLLLLTFATLAACQSETNGTLIKGQLTGAENLQVALDELTIAKQPEQVAITAIGQDGEFALGFTEGLSPGVYQLRIGAQTALLSLDEDDRVVNVTGNLTDLNAYIYDVEGSEGSKDIKAAMTELLSGRLEIEKITDVLGGMTDPNAAAVLGYSVLSRSGAAGLPVHQTLLENLPEGNPNKASYQQYVTALSQQQVAQRATERIQVGQPAPDIAMESPTGETYRLSDLKGQVVLLDFWASWCRPCRAENPNVVKVYDKYKDDGFTIYSVSLDGLDSRRTSGLNPEQLAQATENSKQRWVNAIQKDKLMWPYHVSELKKWESTAGRQYGVTGIPKTFLIDREGKIAAVGLRGAASIERALQQVI